MCYPWLRPYSAHKLDVRFKPCVFLGYSLSQSAYICFDPQSSKFFSSRHVRFIESTFPYPNLLQSHSVSNSSSLHALVPPILSIVAPAPQSPPFMPPTVPPSVTPCQQLHYNGHQQPSHHTADTTFHCSARLPIPTDHSSTPSSTYCPFSSHDNKIQKQYPQTYP